MFESQVVPGSIVVGLDSTPVSHGAFLWAGRQAHWQGVPLTVGHAVGRDIGVWVDVGVLDMREMLEASIKASDELLSNQVRSPDDVAPAVPRVSAETAGAAVGSGN